MRRALALAVTTTPATSSTACPPTGQVTILLPRSHTHVFDAQVRHDGDLGNIEASADGVAQVNSTDPRVQLFGLRSIIGRALAVHAEVDVPGTSAGELESAGTSLM